ncbi:MAG: metallophosphoesterase [Gemmatimonadota bacterium]|nr:metallophosphoesterase [Gemmatimonadota bacterium]
MIPPETVRLLHLSDVHYGSPHVPLHITALEAFVATQEFNAIVVSGDVSQRARAREFRKARDFLARLRNVAPLLVVPGNHDTAWWFGVLNIGVPALIHFGYRKYISPVLEPTLQVPGITVVGLNSSPGIQLHTLTKRPRDLSVRGALKDSQLADAQTRFSGAPPRDLKVLAVHHNIVPGQLSQRWGLTRHEEMLDLIAASGADIVLSGHDHQEKAELVQRPRGNFLASTAGTLSNRSRGARESSFMIVEASATTIAVTPWMYSSKTGTFEPAESVAAPRKTSVTS